IFVAILVCTGVFFLIYKVSSSSHPTTVIEDIHQSKPVVDTKKAETLPAVTATPPAIKHTDNNKADSTSIVRLDSDRPSITSPVTEDSRTLQRNTQRNFIGSQGTVAPVNAGRPEEKTSNAGKEQNAIPADDPAHIRIYGDMIDPKQGFIYNTKETIGAPLNTETRSEAWMDNGTDAKKVTADSLKSILSPEVKSSDAGLSNGKTKNHRLRRGKNAGKEANTDINKPAEANHKQAPPTQGDNNTIPPSEPAPQ
ncbi:MAG TPA: hypothetical protein VGO45_08525, partial [Bacteroidia bacterium]|nr:hypothetical protein [Bacteroidia bacterium]